MQKTQSGRSRRVVKENQAKQHYTGSHDQSSQTIGQMIFAYVSVCTNENGSLVIVAQMVAFSGSLESCVAIDRPVPLFSTFGAHPAFESSEGAVV
jgi:hypothetical protein